MHSCSLNSLLSCAAQVALTDMLHPSHWQCVLCHLQMSLDTKRAEIRKLEERARQREEALKKSEVSDGQQPSL